MDELYTSLGYGKKECPEGFKTLDSELHAHLTAYERKVELGSKKKLSDETRRCATQFLTEKSRGVEFWPDNRHGFPIWPAAQLMITDTIGHILRRKARGSNSLRSKARSKAKQIDGIPDTKSHSKPCKKRQRNESCDEGYGTPNTGGIRRNEVMNEPEETAESRSYTQHIISLNPRADVKKVTDFTMAWLRTESSQWPEMADVKLLTFMHNREFYVSHYGNRSDLINILKKGSEIEILDAGVLYDIFRTRIRERIKFLVSQMSTGIEHPILELKSAGNAQMTKLFATMWRNREEIWELNSTAPSAAQAATSIKKQNLNKHRKTSGSKKPRSPIAFPNLGKEVPTTMEQTRLASMAGLALQMDTDAPEGAESGIQLTDQGPASATAASDDMVLQTRYRSRSLSMENSIVVDSLGRAGATPSTSPIPSSLRDLSWDKLEEILDANSQDPFSGRQVSAVPRDEPVFSMLSTDHFAPSDPTSLGSSRNGTVHVKDLTDNEKSGQFMAVDDTGNARFLKIEPILDTTHSIPATPHNQMLSASRQRTPNPALDCSAQPDHSIRPSWLPEPHARDLITHRAVSFRSPEVSIQAEAALSIETTTRKTSSPSLSSPIPTRSPRTTSPPSSPGSPSAAINKLSHYGSRGKKPGLPPKEKLPTNSHLILKQRLRAEKRVAVRREAAEWHEIRNREARASSQLSRTQEPESGAFAPLSVSARVSIPNEPPGSTDENIDSSKIQNEFPDYNCHQVQVDRPNTKIARCESISSSSGDSEASPEPTSHLDDASNVRHPLSPPFNRWHEIIPSASPAQISNEQNQTDGPCSVSMEELPSSAESEVPIHGLVHLMGLPRETPLLDYSHFLEPAEPETISAALSDAPLTISPSIIAGTVRVQDTSGGIDIQDDAMITDSAPQDSALQSSPDNTTASLEPPAPPKSAEGQALPVQTDESQEVKTCHPSQKSSTPPLSTRQIDTRTIEAPEAMHSTAPTPNEAYALPAQADIPQSSKQSTASEDPNTLPFTAREMDTRTMNPLETMSNSSPTLNEAQSLPMQSELPQPGKASAPSQSSETQPLSEHKSVEASAPRQESETPPASEQKTDTGFIGPPEPKANVEQTDTSLTASAHAIMVAKVSEIRNQGSREGTANATALDEPNEAAIRTSPPPTAENPPPQRHGVYSFVPQSTPFSSKPTPAESASFQALYSAQTKTKAPPPPSRALTRSSLPLRGTKTLELVIESASGVTSVDIGYPFSTLTNNTVLGFFSFYADISQTPIESFQTLIFAPTWPGCSSVEATKQTSEKAWKKTKRLLEMWYRMAQKAEPEEEEFQIMVQLPVDLTS
ncbi:hypothetical protein VTL71DRAFT_3422 [Oculimacula yallundae]|uniref:Uncharacterized protein n=1 Tax=Oculimacula yallundae TaxID=86028 RepID=A0ABR4C744_9HELO